MLEPILKPALPSYTVLLQFFPSRDILWASHTRALRGSAIHVFLVQIKTADRVFRAL